MWPEQSAKEKYNPVLATSAFNKYFTSEPLDARDRRPRGLISSLPMCGSPNPAYAFDVSSLSLLEERLKRVQGEIFYRSERTLPTGLLITDRTQSAQHAEANGNSIELYAPGNYLVYIYALAINSASIQTEKRSFETDKREAAEKLENLVVPTLAALNNFIAISTKTNDEIPISDEKTFLEPYGKALCSHVNVPTSHLPIILQALRQDIVRHIKLHGPMVYPRCTLKLGEGKEVLIFVNKQDNHSNPLPRKSKVSLIEL